MTLQLRRGSRQWDHSSTLADLSLLARTCEHHLRVFLRDGDFVSSGARSLVGAAVRSPAQPTAEDRVVFSEYHAAGSVSGAFMVRKGRWKLIYYVGFAPELFDLQTDPEELTNRAADPACAEVLAEMADRLYAICDPELTDAQAHADQAAMIASYGGREAALKLGAPAATPPPEVTS